MAVAAVIRAEATTRPAESASKVVNEVKVRGEKGALNGAPFLVAPRFGLFRLRGRSCQRDFVR